MLVRHCDFEMEDFFIGDHDLHHEVRLHEVEVLTVPGVHWDHGLGRMLEQQDEALAGLVIGLLHGATEGPPGQTVLIYSMR